jgi:hypothetical protein
MDVIGGSLADGNYTLTIHANKVHDAKGQTLAQDRVFSFFRLFGDTTGKGGVDYGDYFAFYGAYGARKGDANYLWYLDSNGDGVIDDTDFAGFLNNFGPSP